MWVRTISTSQSFGREDRPTEIFTGVEKKMTEESCVTLIDRNLVEMTRILRSGEGGDGHRHIDLLCEFQRKKAKVMVIERGQ